LAFSNSAAKLQLFFDMCKLFDKKKLKKIQKGKLRTLVKNEFALIFRYLGFCFGKLCPQLRLQDFFKTFHFTLLFDNQTLG